jgi:hypothetical protein
MSNQTVFVLCHADAHDCAPISVYTTHDLALEAIEFYATALAKGNNRVFALAEARREFSVVRLNVCNEV